MSENYFYSSLSAQEIEDTLVGAVVFNSDMGLTTSQKAQARANIGAGENDTKVIIMGFFDTLADLQSQIPVGSAGDVYAVGTQSPYDIYIWDATHTEWKDNGPLSFSDAIIDDGDISLSSTWSSQKINTQISAIDLTSLISDSTTASNKTWSSDKISTELSGKTSPSDVSTAVAALVDDSTTSASKTWSSQKIAAEISKLKWTKVWTNPDPTVAFPLTTLSNQDWSGYTELMIPFTRDASAQASWNICYTAFFYLADMSGGAFTAWAVTDSSGTIGRRIVDGITSTGLTFEAASKLSGSGSVGNSKLVPLFIYAR